MIHLPDLSNAEKFKLLYHLDWSDVVVKALNCNFMLNDSYYPKVENENFITFYIIAFDDSNDSFLLCEDHPEFPDYFWLYPENYENESWTLLG